MRADAQASVRLTASGAWHSREVADVLLELGVDPLRGLAPEEARRRLAQSGPNELRQQKRVSPLALFANQFKSVLIIILIVATVLSAFVGEYADALIILVIVIFCAVLGFVQEYRAERALEALKKMLTPTITVLRGGEDWELPSRDLVPGDVLLLEAGDRIPADARLIEARLLHCDEAPLTGESIPVAKELTLVREDLPVGDRRNMVFAGTTVSVGRGKAVVIATAMQTEFGKIAEEVASVQDEQTPLERRTEEIGKWLGIIILAICVLVIGISFGRELWAGSFRLESGLAMIMFAIALAVAAVPEALAAIVTGALAIAMHDMAKRNALVRKMPAVETLGCISVICSDKTGTLTKGEMTVRRLFAGDRVIEVSGAGYAPEGSIGAPLDDPGIVLLLKGAVLSSDAELARDAGGRWYVKGDSTEGALLALAAKGGLRLAETRMECPRVEEFPFSSERKRMTTINNMADGRRFAFLKGAPEVILERCRAIQIGNESIALGAGGRAKLLQVNEDMARDALRVLALAYRELPARNGYAEDQVENELVFLGLVGMMDPPREEAFEAVKVCRQVHVKPVMITGDHRLTAVAVAKELGIFRDGDRVLTGDELATMDEAALEAVVEQVTVYARVSPMDKLKIIRAWKRKGHVVAMTGDGVNDAPALKHADIGVAMGITGTDVAKEAADIVLNDDNFATIVMAIERGRWIYDNIKKYLTYLLRANITEVVVLGGVVVVMGPAYLPLLPAAILYINLATDGLPALALGVAPPDPDIMRRPPRDAKESVFSREVRAFILLGVVIECPIFLWVFFSNLDSMETARTWIFLMFVLIELIIAINFRSLRYTVLEAPPHKWLLLAILWEVALIAILIQFDAVRGAFGITMPAAWDVAQVLALGLVIFVSIEIAKVLLRRRDGRLAHPAAAKG